MITSTSTGSTITVWLQFVIFLTYIIWVMLTQTIFREALLQQMTSLTCFHLESDSPFQKKFASFVSLKAP